MGTNTAFATGDAETKKLWSEKLYRQALKSNFFYSMTGKGMNNIIEEKNDFTKAKGDVVTFTLAMNLSGRGQTSTTTGITLEGNEEAIDFYSFTMTLAEKGNSVKTGSKLDLQRPAFDLRTELKDKLVIWATEEIEVSLTEALLASPSTNRYVDETASPYGAMTLETVRRLKRKARLANPKIRPVKIDGKDVYVLLAHEYAIKGLLADSNFTDLLQNAQVRGSENPLIKGADYFVDGVAIYVTDRSNFLSTGNVVTSLLLGAQAGAIAFAQKPEWNEKLFDYDRIPGVGVDMLVAIGKTKFNSEDYAVIAVDNTYTAD